MIYFVDIDETICLHEERAGERDYTHGKPIEKNIEKINKLYDEGHRIVYYTARGSISGKDWREVTEKQFEEWGVKYHELRLDKPYYDLLIDDKAINSLDFFSKDN